MYPLLSREEINALLNEPEMPAEELSCQLTVDLGNKHIVLKELYDLYQGAVIELSSSISHPCEIRSKGKVVAYGLLDIHDGGLVLRIAHLVDGHDPEHVK